jgi:hypothetical protein
MPLDLWRKHNHQVLEDFLSELAAHLHRPEEEIRAQGIYGTEFPYQWVRIYYGDDIKAPDSVFDFGFAFPLIVPKREAIAVFSQNAGYFVFNHLCIITLRETRKSKDEKQIWSPEDWWAHENV